MPTLIIFHLVKLIIFNQKRGKDHGLSNNHVRYDSFPLYEQIIFGNKWRHLLGERDFWEHIGGIDVSLDPSSFGQANTQVSNHLFILQKSSISSVK